MKTKWLKIKEDEVEKAKVLVIEIKRDIRTRNPFIANQKLNELNDILLNVKE